MNLTENTSESDPLERRTVTCPRCDGSTVVSLVYVCYDPDTTEERSVSCPGCHGTGLVPEPAERWAERLERVARRRGRHIERLLKLARWWRKVVRVLAVIVEDMSGSCPADSCEDASMENCAEVCDTPLHSSWMCWIEYAAARAVEEES